MTLLTRNILPPSLFLQGSIWETAYTAYRIIAYRRNFYQEGKRADLEAHGRRIEVYREYRKGTIRM